jgi:hypothetical protein
MSDIVRCPTCSMVVRIVRRDGGHADHYEPVNLEAIDTILAPQKPEVAERLRKLREGKRTVALVGASPSSCALAPYDDLSVEIWGLNEEHVFPWMKRATRWFQLHPQSSWEREIAKRDITGHAQWLRKNPWNIPIIMAHPHDDVPKSTPYPLRQVAEKAFKGLRHGEEKVRYFTSTFAYMMGYAIEMEHFDRIEVYGVEMASGTEFQEQKACMEGWIMYALAKGIEVYLPDECKLMTAPLYALGIW